MQSVQTLLEQRAAGQWVELEVDRVIDALIARIGRITHLFVDG